MPCVPGRPAGQLPPGRSAASCARLSGCHLISSRPETGFRRHTATTRLRDRVTGAESRTSRVIVRTRLKASFANMIHHPRAPRRPLKSPRRKPGALSNMKRRVTVGGRRLTRSTNAALAGVRGCALQAAAARCPGISSVERRTCLPSLVRLLPNGVNLVTSMNGAYGTLAVAPRKEGKPKNMIYPPTVS
jgi:hypothetical protein